MSNELTFTQVAAMAKLICVDPKDDTQARISRRDQFIHRIAEDPQVPFALRAEACDLLGKPMVLQVTDKVAYPVPDLKVPVFLEPKTVVDYITPAGMTNEELVISLRLFFEREGLVLEVTKSENEAHKYQLK